MTLSPSIIAKASERIKPYINQTPLLESSLLNEWLGHELVFKVEGFQKVGAFKVRGALNTLLTLKEQDYLPSHVVAFSSGNHAQAVAYAASILDIKATICIPQSASEVKRQATQAYEAEIVVTKTRQEAEERVKAYVEEGAYFIHPYDNDAIIAGQGTACFEALQTGLEPDAIFATCGGGGWLSGSYLAKEALYPQAKVIGVEPAMANDAACSLREGEIIKLQETPNTIADGARTLAVSERTLYYLKKLDALLEVDEPSIIYWTQWLTHLLKATIEPTSAVAMAGAYDWLKTQEEPRKVLVLLSGGNISAQTHQQIWQHDYLQDVPSLEVSSMSSAMA